MENKDLIRLKHMVDSTKAILAFIKGKRRSHLDTDRLLASAVIRELEILGEAAGKISEKTQDLFPQIPWKQLIGMRNRLIHAYFDVDHDIVWKTVKEYLPSFQSELIQMISELENI
ncbi:MAG: DUF86 domain-containing protein [Parachlamydiales bacterium]|nr:DUF86 domain-containing protein [Parachlamydiales bacterium]